MHLLLFRALCILFLEQEVLFIIFANHADFHVGHVVRQQEEQIESGLDNVDTVHRALEMFCAYLRVVSRCSQSLANAAGFDKFYASESKGTLLLEFAQALGRVIDVVDHAGHVCRVQVVARPSLRHPQHCDPSFPSIKLPSSPFCYHFFASLHAGSAEGWLFLAGV